MCCLIKYMPLVIHSSRIKKIVELNLSNIINSIKPRCELSSCITKSRVTNSYPLVW